MIIHNQCRLLTAEPRTEKCNNLRSDRFFARFYSAMCLECTEFQIHAALTAAYCFQENKHSTNIVFYGTCLRLGPLSAFFLQQGLFLRLLISHFKFEHSGPVSALFAVF